MSLTREFVLVSTMNFLTGSTFDHICILSDMAFFSEVCYSAFKHPWYLERSCKSEL